ncbi:MAG: hypothetical protein ABI603_01675 [Acidobacteriota bacterium]
MTYYSFADVVRVSERRAHFAAAWVAHAVLVSDFERAESGSGRHRRFSFQNLVEARVLSVLQGFGLPWPVMQRAALTLKRLEIDLPVVAPEHLDLWACVTDATRRRAGDFVLLLLGDVPGGFSVVLGTGRHATIATDRIGRVAVAIDLRSAIEDVERIVGGSWAPMLTEAENAGITA